MRQTSKPEGVCNLQVRIWKRSFMSWMIYRSSQRWRISWSHNFKTLLIALDELGLKNRFIELIFEFPVLHDPQCEEYDITKTCFRASKLYVTEIPTLSTKKGRFQENKHKMDAGNNCRKQGVSDQSRKVGAHFFKAVMTVMISSTEWHNRIVYKLSSSVVKWGSKCATYHIFAWICRGIISLIISITKFSNLISYQLP